VTVPTILQCSAFIHACIHTYIIISIHTYLSLSILLHTHVGMGFGLDHTDEMLSDNSRPGAEMGAGLRTASMSNVKKMMSMSGNIVVNEEGGGGGGGGGNMREASSDGQHNTVSHSVYYL